MNFVSKTDAYLSIEIGGTKLQLIAYSKNAEILDRWRYAISKENGAAGIQRQIQECISEISEHFHIVETGIGFGGPVDRIKGVIATSHQIEGWSGFPLSNWVQSLTGTPVQIENDANVAALGEAFFGAGSDFRTVFYITIGSGIGGGLVQDGQLYHGGDAGESEIGHLRMDMEGNTLETLCAGWAIDTQIRDIVANNADSILAQLVERQPKGGEARYLPAALNQSCPIALKIINDVISKISFGLSHVVHLFNPDIIILGGGVSLIGEPLRNGIEKQLPLFVMHALQPVPKIALASLGEDVVPMGALALILPKKDL